MNRIKIGQIGVCHEHASGKILTLKKMPEIFEIVGVVDDRETSSTPRFAGNDLTPYEGLRFMTEAELFNTPGLQAVTVETPNLELVPAALRCMERNLAIHMDKPGGEELERFAELRRGCEERGLPFQMGYMFRGNPAIQWCVKAIRRGWLGEIFEAQANMNHNYGGEPYQEYLGKFPGGIMFNLGCHLIDFIVAMLGKPERVHSVLKPLNGHNRDAKINSISILEYAHGFAEIRACSTRYTAVSGRRLLICGSKGTIELCPMERFDKGLELGMVLAEPAGGYEAGRHTVTFDHLRDRYENQFRQLFSIVRGETEADPALYDHDLAVHEVVLAASGIGTEN